jgi:uroporphyrinogen-III synthase
VYKRQFDNFPEFEQKDLMISVFGATTAAAAIERNLNITVQAPTEKAPSMTMALDQFISKNNKK